MLATLLPYGIGVIALGVIAFFLIRYGKKSEKLDNRDKVIDQNAKADKQRREDEKDLDNMSIDDKLDEL